MDIIPPEAAQVMSLGSADLGSGPPLIPVSSDLRASGPMLIVSPAIVVGKDEDDKNDGGARSTEMASRDSARVSFLSSSNLGAAALGTSNDKEQETPIGQPSEHLSTDNIALPLRRPSVDVLKPLITQEIILSSSAISSCEPNTGDPVETFVTTKNSTEKPHHFVLPKEGQKPSLLAQSSTSPEVVTHTKTLIQVHTPSSSKTSKTGSIMSESVINRASGIPSGGQKVTLVTRQNDPDHVSIVLNPSKCSTSEIIAAASSSLISRPGSIEAPNEEIDGSIHNHAKEGKSMASTQNNTVSSSPTSVSIVNSSGSRKVRKHSRKASRDSTTISMTSVDEIIGAGTPSIIKKGRKAAIKSPIDKPLNLTLSANNKDVIECDNSLTKTMPVSHYHETQASCKSSDLEKVEISEKSDKEQEEVVSINDERKKNKDLKLILNENTTLENISTGRSIKDGNRRVCSSDVELVPANVIDNSILPEKDDYEIKLTKDEKGLGITVAGYICEKGKVFSFSFNLIYTFKGISFVFKVLIR